MSQSGWGLSSSSSDSDSDDDRPKQSRLRTATQFYRNYQKGEYGADWPIELISGHPNQHHVEIQPPTDIKRNNVSFADANQTSGSNEPHGISLVNLNATPENIVLVESGGKYVPMRVISQGDILGGGKPLVTPSKVKVS